MVFYVDKCLFEVFSTYGDLSAQYAHALDHCKRTKPPKLPLSTKLEAVAKYTDSKPSTHS